VLLSRLSACLLRDGVIVAAAEEERFSRIKHDSGFHRKLRSFASAPVVSSSRTGLRRLLRKAVAQVRAHPIHVRRDISTLAPHVRASMQTWMAEKLWIRGKIRSALAYEGRFFSVSTMSHMLRRRTSVTICRISNRHR